MFYMSGALHILYQNAEVGNNHVTVHSVLSNTLRDAQNLCYSHKFARYVLGFWHFHAKTPRGIVTCEQ